MRYYSTKRGVEEVSYEEAVIQGLPADNGLFMPETIPTLDEGFLKGIHGLSIEEIGLQVASEFIQDEIPEDMLSKIVRETVSFDMPVVQVHDQIYSLELFHGPTCAFKDVGARFLARCLGYFSGKSGRKATILVATSGDTGSAVANGFLGIPGIQVVILYPKGKVSEIQEKQLTTLGDNVTALEVNGTFDDCQALVKQAFLDSDFKAQYHLTSANSINVARLIPQSFYYFHAYSQLPKGEDVYVSVPSGNYGNLTAGLIAKRMGLPIKQFIAASNANDVVPEYLKNAIFSARPSVQTISNAMDVGNPSNFYRLLDLYNGQIDAIRNDIIGYSYTDEATRNAMQEVKQGFGYTLDPHGAVGYLGLQEFMRGRSGVGLFLETAHPAKFIDVVQETLNENIDIPNRLKSYLKGKKVTIGMEVDFGDLKAIISEIHDQ